MPDLIILAVATRRHDVVNPLPGQTMVRWITPVFHYYFLSVEGPATDPIQQTCPRCGAVALEARCFDTREDAFAWARAHRVDALLDGCPPAGRPS